MPRHPSAAPPVVVTLPGTHAIHLEQPDAVADVVLDWLSSPAGSTTGDTAEPPTR
jgi:pimeloyl-ACP methyl ester carboxylesterase